MLKFKIREIDGKKTVCVWAKRKKNPQQGEWKPVEMLHPNSPARQSNYIASYRTMAGGIGYISSFYEDDLNKLFTKLLDLAEEE